MRRYLYTLLIISLFSFNLLGASSTDSVKVSLLTCEPGTEIYALFGHTAIRFENPAKGLDLVFNYGMFSFNTPNFIWRFVKGETDYQLGISEFPYFEIEYGSRGSSVWQQTLNLSPDEKDKLWKILETNYLPDNRIYRYNFFFDNCTTRARDKIEDCIDGVIEYEIAKKKFSFRDVIHQYTKGHEWAEFGIDLCLGSKADEIMTDREQMFVPFRLMYALDSAKILTKKDETHPLIVNKEKIVIADVFAENQDSFLFTPLTASWMLFVFTLLISIYGVWKNKLMWGIDIILYGAAGLAGCVITFLVFFSVHPAVSPNYLLLFLNPIHLIYLPVMIYKSIKRQKDVYHWINLAVLTLFMSLWCVIPQRFNPAVLPLALCLWIRSACHIFMTYKKIK